MRRLHVFVAKLDSLRSEITKLKNQRNHAYTRMKKNQSVLDELRSLNREMQVGSVVCLNCGSDAIGYKLPDSNFVFDLTTRNMRQQILHTVQQRIDAYVAEVEQFDKDIRRLQRRFNSLRDRKSVV